MYFLSPPPSNSLAPFDTYLPMYRTYGKYFYLGAQGFTFLLLLQRNMLRCYDGKGQQPLGPFRPFCLLAFNRWKTSGKHSEYKMTSTIHRVAPYYLGWGGPKWHERVRPSRVLSVCTSRSLPIFLPPASRFGLIIKKSTLIALPRWETSVGRNASNTSIQHLSAETKSRRY